MDKIYVVYIHREHGLSVFLKDLDSPLTLREQIHAHGGSRDGESVEVARPTAMDALRDGSTYLSAAPKGRQQGRIVRPILHLVPGGLK
jgi:hypothetical protein